MNVFISLEILPKSATAGLYGKCMFRVLSLVCYFCFVLENCQTIFQSVGTVLHSKMFPEFNHLSALLTPDHFNSTMTTAAP